MAATKRAVKPWTREEERLMVKLVKDGLTTTQVAKQLRRSPASVRSKAQKRSLSLKPKATRATRPATKALTRAKTAITRAAKAITRAAQPKVRAAKAPARGRKTPTR